MTVSHALHTQVVYETLRPLSPYERLFWAFDRVNVFNFAVAVTFRGTIGHTRWIAAFAEVQERHPFLNASLNLDDPHAPIFMRAANLPVPLIFRPRTSPTEWQRAMEAEWVKPFDPSTAPFLRAVLLEDNDGCDLILTADHVVLDGMGAIGLVRDLLAALSGQKLPPLPVPPSAEDRVACVRSTTAQSTETPQADENVQQAIAVLRERTITRHLGTEAPTIDALRLTPELTAQLLRCCRRQQTTVGSALLAALASALRTLSPALETADIRLAVPIDARPYLDNAADFVLSITSGRGVSPYPAEGLWESARTIRSQLVQFQSFVEIEATFNRVQAAMSANLEPTMLVDYLASKVGHDLLLTNLKCVNFPSPPDNLTIENVWGPSVLAGYKGEHVVGSATFNGALHMLYTSHCPATGLLETVQQTIVAACADA